jgi:RNA polymerase sigma-70 factor (sigma-E family)
VAVAAFAVFEKSAIPGNVPERNGGQGDNGAAGPEERAARGGHVKADRDERFREFVSSRWPRLVRTAYLLTGDQHEAEDVVQSALIKVYRSWWRIVRSDNPDAYVRRILVHCHKDRFRKRRVPVWLTDAVPDMAVIRDPLADSDERQRLMAALATLPPRQRAVVVLRYWEDLSETEVAAALQCSTGTVKSQASKALIKLRAVLAEDALITAQGKGER